jgi:K+-sensing histidine kinase KdpD
LLVWGDPADMLPGQVLSWTSIVGLVFVTIWFRHDPLKLAIWQLTASIFLYLSWFVFAYFGAGPSVLWNSLRVSAPFQVAFVLVAGILIGQIARRHRERRAASSSSSNAP